MRTSPATLISSFVEQENDYAKAEFHGKVDLRHLLQSPGVSC